jgi:hypothetical protein
MSTPGVDCRWEKHTREANGVMATMVNFGEVLEGGVCGAQDRMDISP